MINELQLLMRAAELVTIMDGSYKLGNEPHAR